MKSFEDLLQEKKMSAVDAIDFLKKYKDNPYGIGAEIVEVDKNGNWVTLKFDHQYERNQAGMVLKKKGIPAKLIRSSTRSKAWKFRYEITISK